MESSTLGKYNSKRPFGQEKNWFYGEEVMKVYGLSGRSGTGKSYNAGLLCSRLGIEGLIDDGLFIREGNIIAGFSAKKESTKLRAVRRAIFTDEEHRRSVAEAVRREGIDSILVIGTSDDMVRLIVEKLELPPLEEIIQSEEITTPGQRRVARKSRDEGGIHVIPAPTFQVKKQFSGFFVDAKRSFRRQRDRGLIERTVVRPTYSYLGGFEISDKVISDIVSVVVGREPCVDEVLWISSNNSDDGLYVRIILIFRRDCRIRKTAEELQHSIREALASMTAFNVLGVDIEARAIRR